MGDLEVELGPKPLLSVRDSDHCSEKRTSTSASGMNSREYSQPRAVSENNFGSQNPKCSESTFRATLYDFVNPSQRVPQTESIKLSVCRFDKESQTQSNQAEVFDSVLKNVFDEKVMEKTENRKCAKAGICFDSARLRVISNTNLNQPANLVGRLGPLENCQNSLDISQKILHLNRSIDCDEEFKKKVIELLNVDSE